MNPIKSFKTSIQLQNLISRNFQKISFSDHITPLIALQLTLLSFTPLFLINFEILHLKLAPVLIKKQPCLITIITFFLIIPS